MNENTWDQARAAIDAERRDDQDEAIRFVLGGLGCDSLAEARMLVELGRTLARAGGPPEPGTLRGLAEVIAAAERMKLETERVGPTAFLAAHGLEEEAVYRVAATTAALTRVGATKYADVVAAVTTGISLGLLLAETS